MKVKLSINFIIYIFSSNWVRAFLYYYFNIIVSQYWFSVPCKFLNIANKGIRISGSNPLNFVIIKEFSCIRFGIRNLKKWIFFSYLVICLTYGWYIQYIQQKGRSHKPIDSIHFLTFLILSLLICKKPKVISFLYLYGILKKKYTYMYFIENQCSQLLYPWYCCPSLQANSYIHIIRYC